MTRGVKQEYDDRVAAVTTRDDEDDAEDDACSVDWGGSDDEDDDLGDTGGDLAEDTPDDAGAGSAPPPGAGGCAPPPAELQLDRLPRAAREAKDTPDDAGGGSAPPPGAGGCAPPPAEGEESVLDRLRRAAREAKDGLPVYTQDSIVCRVKRLSRIVFVKSNDIVKDHFHHPSPLRLWGFWAMSLKLMAQKPRRRKGEGATASHARSSCGRARAARTPWSCSTASPEPTDRSPAPGSSRRSRRGTPPRSRWSTTASRTTGVRVTAARARIASGTLRPKLPW